MGKIMLEKIAVVLENVVVFVLYFPATCQKMLKYLHARKTNIPAVPPSNCRS